MNNPLAIEPQFVTEQEQPAAPEFSDPAWVVDTWRKLYFHFPSPGLKKRVREAEQWGQSVE